MLMRYYFLLLQGERLSHAVGCAFAACLERKQKRDKECGVTMNFDTSNSTFTRTGSFRQPSITERLSEKNQENSVKSASGCYLIDKVYYCLLYYSFLG